MGERRVLPGEELAVVEEYEAGEGTYEEDGRVYAAQPGVLSLDAEHRVARVTAFNPPADMRLGDVIYGTVTEIRSSMAEARVLAIHGRGRQVAGELDASLHVSRISNAYTEDIRDAMRLGDILRMRVIQTDPSLQVTTAEQNLGVVLALCVNDRRPMVRRGDQVYCTQCERTARRKLAADYGGLELTAPIVRAPEPEAPRREPRDRDERGDRGRGRGRGPPGRDRGGGGGRGRGGGRGGRPPGRR
jgi:exosome complex component CSL4